MITDRIKALFNFIEFLHSNIDHFKRYDILINELYSLDIERNNVKPQNNFADKLKYDEVQAIIKDKFNVIQSNIILPIQDKSNELNICDWNKTETLWNYNILEINELKENFSKNDLPEILEYKNKYIEFRTVTNCNYFQSFFFNDLDKILKVLFDFFKETTENEFEAFETKTIEVNSIEEAIQILTAKENKDERFWLTTFFDDKEQETLIYKSHQRQIENNGCFTVKMDNDTVKIYTPALAVILTSNELSARNMETQTETTVNGRDYLNTYIEAYKEGEQYFEKEYKVSPNTLYGENAEQYVKDIHLNYFHINHSGTIEGWGYVKKEYPYILTHKVIRDFGYYSGIVNKVEEQVKKYPKQFQTFEICEHQNPPQQLEAVKPKKRRKTLLEFIHNIDDKEAFLNDLKNTFPTEIGLSIKAIVIRLVCVKILIYGTKEFKNFYDELTKYFDRNIGTYGSINDYNPDSKIIGTINDKLNPLIIKYKSK